MSSSRVLSSASARGPRTMPPGVEALFTSTSTRPKALTVASTRWATDSELIVSATIGMMRRPVSCESALAASSRAWRCRAQIATSTPSDASTWAIARPMPLLPPVTIATRPVSPRSMWTLLGVAFESCASVKTTAGIVDQAGQARHLSLGGNPGRSRLPEAERRIQRRKRRAEEDPALDRRQQRRTQEQRQHLRHEPPDERIAAPRAEQHPLGSELKAVKRPDIVLSQALDRLQILARDRAMPEARIELLSGHRGGGDGHVDADGASRAHGVGGVADQQQAVAGPLAHQPNDAPQGEERREVVEGRGEVREDRIEAPHALGHRGHPVLAPASPFAGGHDDPGLNVVRVLGQHETADIAQRDVEGAGPAGRLLDREPDDVEVVVLVLRLEPAEPRHRRMAPVSAHDDVGPDFERLLAMTEPAHAHHLAVLFEKLRHLGAHPALERRERLRLAKHRIQKDRLRHPDGVGIPGGDPLEAKLADLFAVEPDLADFEKRVGLGQHVLQKPQLVEQMRGARLQHLPTKLPLEVFVTFQHQDVGAPFGQKQAQHQPARPAAHDARARANARHGSPLAYSAWLDALVRHDRFTLPASPYSGSSWRLTRAFLGTRDSLTRRGSTEVSSISTPVGATMLAGRPSLCLLDSTQRCLESGSTPGTREPVLLRGQDEKKPTERALNRPRQSYTQPLSFRLAPVALIDPDQGHGRPRRRCCDGVEARGAATADECPG